MKAFKRIVILDSVIFYPEHRQLLNSMADEIVEYPSSLPTTLEQQYDEQPELFKNKKCYTQIAADNTPLQLLMNRVEGAEVIISCWTNIPDEILRLNPQLKLIIFWTHEKEHRVNMQLADELGITVTNIPDYGTDAVAEVVFAGLYELLLRNYQNATPEKTESEIAQGILAKVFDHYRMLRINEKYTRSGKFTHHFHKLGKITFDFDKKNIEDLIPEQLIAYKRIGFLNVELLPTALDLFHAFHLLVEQHKFSDPHAATYYKFLAENDLIFYDSTTVSSEEIFRAKQMFPLKCIDIQKLPRTSYSFQNKTFGIIGLGRIGTHVARIAKQLGFQVLYFSKTRTPEIEKELGIEYRELDDLLRTSNIISLHVPAHNADNLLDAKRIQLIRPGTIFINTADGNALDQHALTQRMLNNEVLTYLDVYPGLPRKDILGLPMKDKKDWKLHQELSQHVLAYRAGWKTQESIRVKTYKLLGEMFSFINN